MSNVTTVQLRRAQNYLWCIETTE